MPSGMKSGSLKRLNKKIGEYSALKLRRKRALSERRSVVATSAEKLFSETFGRNLNTWSTVGTFRQTLQAGLVGGAEAKARQAAELYDLLTTSPEYSVLLTNVDDFRKALPKDEFVGLSAKQSMETTINSLDAATILFAHSMVDGAAFDYCRVTALHAPQDSQADDRTSEKNACLVSRCCGQAVRG